MMVGDPATFALESEITLAYSQPSWRALGFFVLHIKGKSYGVRKPHATMLAASFDEVVRRIAQRGRHHPPFPMAASAADIAYSFRRAFYENCAEGEMLFGMSVQEFKRKSLSNRIQWAPDGDEAFDDGSYVLQFDNGPHVRLVAFTSAPEVPYDPLSLRDADLPADNFYAVLSEWERLFRDEWASCPKVSDLVQ